MKIREGLHEAVRFGEEFERARAQTEEDREALMARIRAL
jgi:hypothetical protein